MGIYRQSGKGADECRRRRCGCPRHGATISSRAAVNGINSAIEAQEGTTGTYKVAHELIAGISGNHILYYLNQAKYCEKTYTFKISGGRTVTITLKFYTGMQITYTNVEASQHSGGKI